MTRKACQISLLGLAIILTGFLLGCSRDPIAKKQKFLAQGDRAFAQSKFAEATIDYARALQIDPRFEEAHYKLAQCYLKQNSWTAAYQELMQTVEVRPANWAAQLDLGNLLLRAGKGQDAKERALLILRGNPENPDAQILLSSADVLLGNTKEALEEAQDAVRMAPKHFDSYLNLGLIQARYGVYDQAEENLVKAQTLDPDSDGPLITLGTFYLQQRRWSDAEKQFQSAIWIAPKDLLPRTALASLYRNQGQEELAEKLLADTKRQLNSDPNAYRLLGDYYISRGDTSRALAEFESLTRDHPNDLTVRKSYAQLLILSGRIAEASKITDQILKKSSGDVEGLILKGQILLQQKNNDDALSTLQLAVRNGPDNPAGHYQLGIAFQAKDNADQALGEWKEAVQLRPNFAEARIALGSAAAQRKDWRELENEGNELQKIAPSAPEGYLFCATARFNLGDALGAEGCLNRLVQIAPQSPLGYAKLGQLRTAQKRWNEAENFYKEALNRAPNFIDAIRGLTELDLERGKTEQALQFIQVQIDRNPNNAALYLLQGVALLQNKQLADAEKAFLRCTEIDQQNLAAFVLLGRVQSALGRPSDGVSSYQRAIAIAPNNASLYTALGVALEAGGNWKQAQTAYQKSLAIQPNEALAANNLAYLMLEHDGHVNVALSLAQTARRGLPNLPNSADTLGWAYFHNGAYTLAVSLLSQAVKQAPTSATYRYHLGMAYRELKNKEHARSELEKSIKLDPKAPSAQKAALALGELAGR